MASGIERPPHRDHSGEVQVTVKEQASGTIFGVGGLLLGLFASYRILSIIGPLLGGFADCGEPADLTLGSLRVAAIVAAVAGVAAVALSEFGVRREMRPHIVGVIGSVLGIFSTIAGGAVFAMLLVPSLSSCFPT